MGPAHTPGLRTAGGCWRLCCHNPARLAHFSFFPLSCIKCSSCGKEDGEFYAHCKSHCLDLSDLAMGLLTGPAFTFSSVIVSLPLGMSSLEHSGLSDCIFVVLINDGTGWAADRWRRSWILCAGLVVWSAATFLACFSGSFWHLALSRILLGIGGVSPQTMHLFLVLKPLLQATVAPTAYSLLSDYFHPNKRALVFAFFTSTIYLGELVICPFDFEKSQHK